MYRISSRISRSEFSQVNICLARNCVLYSIVNWPVYKLNWKNKAKCVQNFSTYARVNTVFDTIAVFELRVVQIVDCYCLKKIRKTNSNLFQTKLPLRYRVCSNSNKTFVSIRIHDTVDKCQWDRKTGFLRWEITISKYPNPHFRLKFG